MCFLMVSLPLVTSATTIWDELLARHGAAKEAVAVTA